MFRLLNYCSLFTIPDLSYCSQPIVIGNHNRLFINYEGVQLFVF